MQSIHVVEEAKDTARIRRTGAGCRVRELDIEKRRTFFDPNPRKLHRGGGAFHWIGRVEMRVAGLRQPIESAHRTRARRRDTWIGIGEKRQSGSLPAGKDAIRSEEHTSELQSPCNLVC